MTTEMKTIQVSEATPLQIDWLVAKCSGRCTDMDEIDGESYWVLEGNTDYEYSTRWNAGGPIIEREGIKVFPNIRGAWTAQIKEKMDDGTVSGYFKYHNVSGPTPLIAAMRTFIASKLGDTVEVPEDLA